MSLTELLQRKLKLEMKLLHIVDKRPKNIIKLQALDEEDYILSHQAIQEWSQNNEELYHIILENGMAEFVCNWEYLFEFYRHLSFDNKMLTNIDQTSLRFKNLAVLSLVQNQIKTIQHIPVNCKELYLDFNQISSIRLKDKHKLELLSISHNIVNDQSFNRIIQYFPQLRCVNVSWNRISNLKEFVTNLAFLSKLNVLISYGNPISMLAIYYSYITDHISLAYIDGEKYAKEEVKKQEPKVEQKKEVKEQKKDTKKDNKKGAKVEQKPIEEPPKVEPPKQITKKQLTKQDFEKVRLNIRVSNLQKFTGNLFQASLFPPDTDNSKIQTNYWIKYSLFGEEIEQKLKICTFDSATTENDEIRLNLDVNINKTFTVNYENLIKFNQGLKIEVCKIQPKMVKDPQTLQIKPEIKDNSVVTVSSVLGGTRIDLRKLHLLKKKEDKLKYVLFSPEAANSALFYDPFENQKDIISQKKQAFEGKLKKLQQQRLKKLQEQQVLKQQKKGGKDQKKAADKKPPAKKDGKESAPIQMKKSQKCDFATEARQYCINDEQKMFKGKELLCVWIKID